MKGQQDYAALRTQLLDKYQSSKCKNSSDCTLVLESNPCASVCNVPLPSGLGTSYQSNLAQTAATGCASCPAPPAILCEQMVPACVNEKCVAANPP